MTNLSGFWTGVYDYPDDSPPTSFNATIVDRGGSFYGEIVEPNEHAYFETDELAELVADINGFYDGGIIKFFKKYMPLASKYRDYVEYVGTINDDFTKIEGRWVIPGDWFGKFVMNRSKSIKQDISIEESELLKVK